MAEAIDTYYERGWTCIPVTRQHTPSLKGYTGRDERDLSLEQMLAHYGPTSDASGVGLRMPRDVIGIDIDAYGEKRGFDTVFWYEEGPNPDSPGLGPLPHTYLLTSRNDGMSGIRFYRVPTGLRWRDVGGDVETIWRGHRFAMAAPSVSKKTMLPYLWRHSSDWSECGIPSPNDLPELPANWVRELTSPRATSKRFGTSASLRAPVGRDEAERVLATFPTGSPDSCIEPAWKLGLRAARGELGAARPALPSPVFTLLRAGFGGCTGSQTALLDILAEYDRRDPGTHADKFWHLIETSLENAREAGWDCMHIESTAEVAAGDPVPYIGAESLLHPGWRVRPDGTVQTFDELQAQHARANSGFGDPDPMWLEDPADVWERWRAAGDILDTEGDTITASEAICAAIAAEKRKVARKRAGYVEWDNPNFWSPPKPKVVIPGLALEGQTVNIVAPGGVGKSLKAQDVAVGLTVRGAVFGEPVEQTSVIYLDRENSMRGVSKRFVSMGVSESDTDALSQRLHYSLLGEVPPLDTEAGGTWLANEVNETGATVVIIDTASKVISGEENSNDTWAGLHNQTLTRLRARGVAVVILDHVGKDESKGARGGSAKKDNCDVLWYLTFVGLLPTGDELLKVTCGKDRDGDFGGEGAMRYLVRESSPVTRHRFALDFEILTVTDAATAKAKEYEKLVVRVAQENPATNYTVRAMREAVRDIRGTCEDGPVGKAMQILREQGRLTANGRWIPSEADVAGPNATETPRATENE